MADAEQGIRRLERLLGAGYLGKERVREVLAELPALPGELSGWMRSSAESGDWRRLELLSAVAVHADPESVRDILPGVLDSGRPGMDREAFVDMLGEVRAVTAIPAVVRLARSSATDGGPYYSLTLRCIAALGEIDSTGARDALLELTASGWPDPVRWHAAVELGIEEDLGFDEDEMLKYP